MAIRKSSMNSVETPDAPEPITIGAMAYRSATSGLLIALLPYDEASSATKNQCEASARPFSEAMFLPTRGKMHDSWESIHELVGRGLVCYQKLSGQLVQQKSLRKIPRIF